MSSDPIPCDLYQITAPINRQNRQPGDPCHTLARDNAAHAAVAFAHQAGGTQTTLGYDPDSGTTPTLAKSQTVAVAFSCKDSGADASRDLAPTLRSMTHDGSHSNGGGQVAAIVGMQVRRLTPRECERLQGFPDDYTLVPHRGKPAADGPRYKALGNSMAVPCMRWIGERIAMVDELITAETVDAATGETK